MRNTPAKIRSKANRTRLGDLGLAFELQRDLVVGCRELLDVDVDLDVDRRLRLFGASERGAFGFSNEKSLMYCASTLSCGGVCGCAPASAPDWPPLVDVIDAISHCSTTELLCSAAWLTQAPRIDKDDEVAGSRPPLSVRSSPMRCLGNLMPLVGLQIDDRGARPRAGLARAGGRSPLRPSAGPMAASSSAPSYIGDKARNHQKNPAEHAARPGLSSWIAPSRPGAQVDRNRVEVAPARSSEHDHAERARWPGKGPAANSHPMLSATTINDQRSPRQAAPADR